MNSKNKYEEIANSLRRNVRIYKCLFLLSLVGLAVVFFVNFNFRNKQALESNRYPLINPLRNSIPQKDFIVNVQPLRDFLNSLTKEQTDKDLSIYFEVLNTGANISINPNLGIFPASLAKLPLGMAVMKKVENGKWKMDNQLVLFEQDMDKDSGILYQRPVGTAFTIEELLRELLVNSDNTAYKILLRNMDASELFEVVEEIGLEELFDKEGQISAKEYSRMFRALYNSSFLKRENSSVILELLTETSFNDYLVTGLPSGTKFAHKIGENDTIGVYSDVGIVYIDSRPYLLAVMVKDKDIKNGEIKAKELMKTISTKVYEYVQEK